MFHYLCKERRENRYLQLNQKLESFSDHLGLLKLLKASGSVIYIQQMYPSMGLHTQ